MADLYYIEQGYFTPDGYYVYTADAEAAISDTLILSATVGVIKPFVIDISATADVTAVISHIHGADLQAFSDAALTTTPNIIKNIDSNITATTSQSSVEERIRNADAAWTSTFTLVIETGQIELAQADLSASSSLSVDSVANRSASITQDTIVTLSSQNDRIRFADSSLSILSSVTTDIVKTVEASSTISSSSTQTTNIERIQQGTISVTALFTPTLDAVVTVNSFAVLESNVSVTVQAQKQTDIVSNQSSTITLSVSVAVTKDYLLNLSSTASLTAAVIKSVEVSINVTSAFAPSLSVTVFKNQVAVLSSEFTSSISARKTARGQIQANVSANISIQIRKITGYQSNNEIVSSVYANAGLRELGQAAISVGSALITSRTFERPFTFVRKAGTTTTSAQIITENQTINGVANAGRVKYGTGALNLLGTNNGLESSIASSDFFIPNNTEFFIGVWIYGNTNIPAQPNYGNRFIWVGNDTDNASLESGGILQWGLGFGENINTAYYPYRVRFLWRTSSSTFNEVYYDTPSGTGGGTFNQWNYWSVKRELTSPGTYTIKMYWNNSLVDQTSTDANNFWRPTELAYSPELGTYSRVVPQKLRISNRYFFLGANNTGLFVDNFVFKVGDSTVTGYSSASENTANTRVLLPFNTDFNDVESLNQTGQAAINSTVSVSASIRYNTNGKANFTSTSSVTATATKNVQTSTTLSSQSNVAANNVRIRYGQSSINGAVTISASPTVTRRISQLLDVTAQTVVNNSRTRAVGIQTDSIATQLSAVAKIGDFLIAFDANITSVVSAVKTTDIVSNQTAQSTLSTDADLIANGATSISSSTNVSASFDRTRDHTVDIGATVSQTTLPVKTTDSTITLNSQFNQLVETSGIIGGQANLESIASINCVITRNRFADSTLAATTSVQTDAIVVLQASASFSAESNTSIDNSRTRAVGIQTDSIATQLTAVALTGQGFITLDAPVTLTTVAIKTAVSSSDLNSSFNVYCLFGIIKPAASSLNSTASLSADGVVGIVGESYNQTTVTLDCVAVKTTEVTSTNSIITSVSALAVRTRRVGIQLFASGGQLIEGRRIKFAQANLVTTSTMTCLGGVNLVILNQTLFNTATVTAQVRSIHIDPYLTWIVDEESRSYKINQETRLRKIAEETRTHIIEGA